MENASESLLSTGLRAGNPSERACFMTVERMRVLSLDFHWVFDGWIYRVEAKSMGEKQLDRWTKPLRGSVFLR
jgi:hypothetical protein